MVGVDLTPERFEAGERPAREAGVAVEWVEGDAEDLPFDNESFDVVFSSFGAMFAPRHEVTAAEMARVLRRGGRLGLCNWTPEGIQGDFFRPLGAHLPPPPDFAQPPLAWGSEGHVRESFVGTGRTLEFERDAVALPYESGDEAFEFGASNFGPLIAASGAGAAGSVGGPAREGHPDLRLRRASGIPHGSGTEVMSMATQETGMGFHAQRRRLPRHRRLPLAGGEELLHPPLGVALVSLSSRFVGSSPRSKASQASVAVAGRRAGAS